MEEVLALALHGMHQDMVRMERVGMNLTNALTPGYKREIAVVRPFGDYLHAGSAEILQEGQFGEPASIRESITDFRPGTLKATSQSLDFALAGQGFFEVLTDDGPAYTRQGSFQIDARGRLLTHQGYPVMGKGGEIILSSGQPTVDETGNIVEMDVLSSSRESRRTAQFKIVKFDEAKSLQRMGDGIFTSGSVGNIVDDKDIQLRQGYLENSNVSTMQEMVQLMQTMRHFESMQRVAQGYDGMIGVAIRKLGEI